MNVFDSVSDENEIIKISNHAMERSVKRCEVDDEYEVMDMVNQAAVVTETNNHIYKRDTDFVYVLGKKKNYKTLKTIMYWDDFKRNIQEKIERYN